MVVSFHRGILPDRIGGLRTGVAYAAMAALARSLGFEVINAAYEMKKISFYKEFDLHIGYRVHGHLDFLSRRKPSLLINEDGRGLGMVKSMGLPELNYGDRNLVEKCGKLLRKYKAGDFESLSGAVSVIDTTFVEMKSFLQSIV